MGAPSAAHIDTVRMQRIEVHEAATHNLKKVSCSIPKHFLCCVTGVSGSGKSSFAFDTLFIEGQRRYIQSLSPHAKRIVGNLPRPDVASITGLTPTIALEQKTSSGGNPRSTVGTITEIHDYLRILYAKMAVPHCPITHEPLITQSVPDIIQTIFKKYSGKILILLAPIGKHFRGELKEILEKLEHKGFSRVRLDSTITPLSSISNIDPTTTHSLDVVIDRVEISPSHEQRLLESIQTALEIGNDVFYLLDLRTNEEELFSKNAFSKSSGVFYPQLSPHDFSFNSPQGMCDTCQGLGVTQEFILEKIIDPKKSVSEDFCLVAPSYSTKLYRNIYDNLAHIYNFSVETPWEHLSSSAHNVLLYGTEKKWVRMVFINPLTGASWYDNVRWQGILYEAKKKYQEATSKHYKQKIEELLFSCTCPACKGSRLKPYPAAAKFQTVTLPTLCSQTIDDVASFFASLPIENDICSHILSRLEFLKHVGVGYLTLNRNAHTLSGGEFQRVKLASHIGSGLSGITYILDEPSIGLHPHDNDKLISSLSHLKNKGNTVIVVEHDASMMLSSDWIIDFGPKAGTLGGEILYEGTLTSFKKAKNSITASYLFGEKKISRPYPRKEPSQKWITLHGASLNNLKKDTLSIPLGLFVAITGVSGSGKSSLIIDTLYNALSNKLQFTKHACGPYSSLSGTEYLDKVIHIDQSPIGRTPRSNPATYSGVFDDIRALFSSLPESKARGWLQGRFSFNVKEGSCPVCNGMGMIELNVDFLEATWVQCGECQGKRFDPDTLSILYKGKSIHDVLSMTCAEAKDHFSAIPPIHKGLDILCKVGLEYLQLGQSSTTLSGGEAQRLKIAKELARPATGKTFYILDEPTTGLHFHDLSLLLDVLHTLVERKNTVVVIEHNMDLVKTADWVIDLGPSSGEKGGHIISEGPPEELATLKTATGKALSQKKPKRITLPPSPPHNHAIVIKGAHQNNLKNLSLSIPKNSITVLTGNSGVGKASLAFDTLYAEGQRMYVESLSPYARQFIKQLPKPLYESIEGLSPAIAIEHRRHASNPRSTIGTMTEIYDYLRILYSCLGKPYCPQTGFPVQTISKERIAEIILDSNPSRTFLYAPLPPVKSSLLQSQIAFFNSKGYFRFRIQGTLIDTQTLPLPQFPPNRLISLDVLVDRLLPSPDEKKRLLSSIEEACRLGDNKVLVLQEGKQRLFNLAFSVEETGESYPPLTPLSFSFSSPLGMCHDCRGIGSYLSLDIASCPLPHNATVLELLSFFFPHATTTQIHMTIHLLQQFNFPIHTPIKHLSAEDRHFLLSGSTTKNALLSKKWIGIQTLIELFLSAASKDPEDLISMLPPSWAHILKEIPCPSCNGSRLNPFASAVLLEGKSLPDLCLLPLDECASFLETVKKCVPMEKTLLFSLNECLERLRLADLIGISYLSLSRSVSTLSMGETQKIHLLSQIGSKLSELFYVIDEPTAGLHPDDTKKFLSFLTQIKNLNNTLLLIEHDPLVMKHADHIIALGETGGKEGGKILYEGSYKNYLKVHNNSFLSPSSTSSKKLSTVQKLATSCNSPFCHFFTTEITEPTEKANLCGKNALPRFEQSLKINNISFRNLLNFSCSLPLNAIVGIAGVAGSGKSTLLFDVIEQALLSSLKGEKPPFPIENIEHIKKIVSFNQKPHGSTSRSDVITYLNLGPYIRELYASQPQAAALSLQPSHFSPNHKNGMCPTCFGMGYKKIDMYFLPPEYVTCDACKGLRFTEKTLSVEYKGINIGSLFQLPLSEVYPLFSSTPNLKITKILKALIDMGLSYIHLGQEMTQASFGEVTRLKLAIELSHTKRKETLYLFDEPSLGLSSQEVTSLINTLHTLREKGNSIFLIEHNLDILAACDHIIEIGPGAGNKGGKLIIQASPCTLLHEKTSRIGYYLRETLKKEGQI